MAFAAELHQDQRTSPPSALYPLRCSSLLFARPKGGLPIGNCSVDSLDELFNAAHA